MATKTPNMPFGTDEPPHETPMSRAFPALLTAVRDLIIAEREFGEVNYSFDPAFADWLTDTERTHERLTDTLRAFHALPYTIPEDRPLQRMARLIDAMLGHEEPGGARQLCREMRVTFFSRFHLHGIGPTALHRNALLAQARHLVAALAALPLFDGAPEAVEDELQPELIAAA